MSDVCLNCGAEIKTTIFTSNGRLPPDDLVFVRTISGAELRDACGACGPTLISAASRQITDERDALRAALEHQIGIIPLASIPSPHGWTYDVLGLVTAQSVTGTGMFSDVASAFTDLFGTQSGAYNKKIRSGEDLCRASIRAQCLELGGSAVLGVDVDYAEVGGQRAMLMVCMTGTAVRLANPKIISDHYEVALADIAANRDRYRFLTSLATKRHLL